jgi:hypothetical protein
VVDGGLDLVFLAFNFEFYVADFHFDFDGWLLRFCHVLSSLQLLHIVLCMMHKHNI